MRTWSVEAALLGPSLHTATVRVGRGHRVLSPRLRPGGRLRASVPVQPHRARRHGLGLPCTCRTVRPARGVRPAFSDPAGGSRQSNSERVIVDYFTRSGIRYVYEQPVMGRWGSRRISRPDFYLPDYGVYVEYWGWPAYRTGQPGRGTRGA